ncbi:MAG: hypothetical protein Q8896_14165 [Bacteroidota bacterium]|nr:hypothetical protein [Bacteroidota bacterium]
MRTVFYRSILALAAVMTLGFRSELCAQPLRCELAISPRPSTRLAEWSSRRETATLMIFNTGDKPANVKIDARLSLNGSLIASTKAGSMPVLQIPVGGPAIFYAGDLFPENAVSFFGDLKQTTMRSGILPEGSYELCITLMSPQTNQPVSAPTCRSFFLAKLILPTLLQPEDNKKIISGTQSTTLFVWSPLIPVSSASVVYRLRLVEVLPGQSAQQAFSVNLPLFERTAPNSTQLLWPPEIPLPASGATLAWGVQPEDDQGNPLVLPERYTNAFNLIVLPSKDECAKLQTKIANLRQEGLAIEEQYWSADGLLQRTTQLLEEAEERADALDIQKMKTEVASAGKKLEEIRVTFDSARKKYDDAITKYEECLGK